MMRFGFVSLAAILAGCSEVNLSNIGDGGQGVSPKIEVNPGFLDYGMVEDDAEVVRTFTVKNVGGAPLTVDDVTLDAPASYTILTDVTAVVLDPEGTIDVDVAFTPLLEGENVGKALVLSDDPGSPETPVDLLGSSTAPMLIIDPNPLDFGSTAVSCETSADVYLVNIGLETLVIDRIDFGSSDGAMTLTDPNVLPLSLDPGLSSWVTVHFEPSSLSTSTALLTVTSNDPRGVQTADQRGQGEYGATNLDVFDKPIDPPVDLLFAVDQSCSMDGHAAELSAAFDSFITQINTVTAGWRIGVATKDSGCFNSGFIEATTPNYQTVFGDAVALGSDINPNYLFTEKLFKVVDNALQETNGGGCNAGFLRAGSMLHIIFVSDETEQSGTNWNTWLNGYLGYVSDPALLKISSIVDINQACGDGSGPGGYDDIALATGGLVLNVCNSNWANYTDDLAALTLQGLDEYVLSGVPDQGSIVVTVDGQQWVTGWHYDAATNSIVFDEELPEGAHIEVEYGVLICE